MRIDNPLMAFVIIVTILFLVLCFSVISAHAEWTKADTLREVSWQVLHIVDWGQTRHIAKNPDQFYEINPILGRHPSVGEVDTYMITGAVIHTAVSVVLPQKYRSYWQYVTIGMSGYCVGNNINAGIKVDF